MRLLAIETATPAQGVALAEDDRLLAELSYEAKGNTRGGLLLPAVDRVLKQAGLAAGDLDAVAVSVGPGSFTGLRVGLATAKGLALGTGATVVGVPTLEALAEGYAHANVTICALLDAYRSEVYMALFRRQGNALERLSPDTVLSPEAVASAVAAVEGPVHLIGSGAARYREQLETALSGRACVTDEGLRAVPSAAVVARLGFRQLAGGNKSDAEVAPIYLRRAEAEVNREKGLLKSPLARVSR
jgi:tRNA threonylcarbamoyladenosine biosynthesis protein TsaB